MSFPVTGFESNGSERYTCLLGIGVVQSGLLCFFLFIVVCVWAFANLPLASVAGICKCRCGSVLYAHTAVAWGHGPQYAALRAYMLAPVCVCTYISDSGIRMPTLIIAIVYLKLTC